MDAPPAAPTSTDRSNILDILSALEVGTKKEEEPVLTGRAARKLTHPTLGN
jgi:hypothetical protein